MTEPVLSGFASEITERFEELYEKDLVAGKKAKYFKGATFTGFNAEIQTILEKYMQETFELYQKLILIEAMYAQVPQKWCLPLLEQASVGDNIIPMLSDIPKQYQVQLKRAIDKVNDAAAPVWEIFQVPTTDFQPFE
jgi:hypothetical protein